VLFYCSEAGRNITGIAMPIDGAWTAQWNNIRFVTTYSFNLLPLYPPSTLCWYHFATITTACASNVDIDLKEKITPLQISWPWENLERWFCRYYPSRPP
jgi:hypothetical protein